MDTLYLQFRRFGKIWTTLIDPTIDGSRLIQLLNEARLRLQASGPQVVSAAVAEARDSTRTSTPADAGNQAGHPDSVFRPPQGDTWRRAWAITEALMLKMRDEVKAGGAEFWLATVSAGWQVHPDPAVRAAAMRRLGIDTAFYPERRLEGFAKAHGIDIVTLAEPLQRYAERQGIYLHGFANTAYGEGHWNQNGHRRAGELMAERLCRGFANR